MTTERYSIEELEFDVCDTADGYINIFIGAPIRFDVIPKLFVSPVGADITITKEDFKCILKAMLRLDEQL